MTDKSLLLICVAPALSFCFLASAQQLPSTPASAEIKVGDAAIKTSKGETTGAESTPSGIPKEFQPLDDESKKLADSVDQALKMVVKAVTDENKEELRRGLDELIDRIDVSITHIRDKLEPEARGLVKRAQARSAESTKKASEPGLSSNQRERWATMARSYEDGAKIGYDVIAKMQDVRVELIKNFKNAKREKELTIETLNNSNLEFMKNEMKAVADDMKAINLRIRSLVISISAWRSN